MPGPVPKSVGKYQVLERLATGGMAELYKARATGQHGFEKLVAIKKILPHLAADASFVEMFLDEARITAQLDHPNIVQVFELGTDSDTPYIAMQFVDGLDVLALLRECSRTQIRLPPELAARIAHDVLEALDYAHTARDSSGRVLGVIHRDVSPGNVLVSRRGDVRLTDFGIARAAERQHKTEAGTLKGKYGYMSPEQVHGGELDARSDLFSVGILLAEMIMARRLFTAPSDLDTLLMVRDARLERLHKNADDFPLELRVICEKSLSREPSDRFANAAEMRDAIALWMRDQRGTGARDLAEFVMRVEGAPTDGVVVAEPAAEFATLSGPSTRMTHEKAAAEARVARQEFIGGVPEGAPRAEITDDSSSGYIVVEERESSGKHGPTETGDFRGESPIHLLYRLARERAHGLLVVEGRAGILKEIYVEGGHPQFVSSNVINERLGDYLVAQGVLTPQALARAIAVMPHFGGRLADTLVGLGLVRPLEAFRLLAKQVSAKLVDVCGWSKGRWRWYAGRPSPPQNRPLHLDAFKCIGAGAAALDLAFVDDWAAAHASALVVQLPATPSDLDAFGLGEAPRRVHDMLDGRSTVGDLLSRVRSADARTNFLRLLYLLVQTDLARLS
ncbi:MAG TPA: serine/threonine-protein kinase [Kofleriaceae bacterium]|nr:serine/threonine-protein kinase [Kofleriaceae bacterium]